MYFKRNKKLKFKKRRNLISIQEEKASREKKNLYNSVINDKKRRMNKIIKAFSPLSIIWFQDDDGCDIENNIGHMENNIEDMENDIEDIENDINSEFTINTQTNNSVVFKIQTSDILFNIAKSFAVFLQKLGFQANIASTKEINTEIKNEEEDPNTIYIFLFIGMISKIPVKSKFYIYNLEQMQYYQNFEKFVGDCNWESGVIMNELFSNAERVFDYSEKNLDFYPNYLQHKVKYLPIPFNLKKRKNINIEKKYDILFFGTQNQRRRKIINYLKKNTDFKILAFSNIFDEELFDYIKKSKVVVNLHFKMSALLETARIQDCLDGIFNYNTFFISETSIDKNTMDNYEHLVEFIQPIKTNFSNIYTLIDKLTKIINNDQKSNTELIKTSVLNLNKINKKQYSYFITNYGDSLTNFKYFYNIDNKTELNNLFKTNKKMAHRYKCYSKISIIKNIIINNFGDKSNQLETILIEFRLFPHLEFLLRNTIIKLPNWNHTIVCGNNNFEFMVQICENICNNTGDKIKIIKLDIDNLSPSEYSQLLTSGEFWNNFEGEKLLVYQEDSVLFHKNIEPFLKFDYIGAPWPINQDDNSYGVGNGGFSLRSKSKMLQCLESIKPDDLKLGKSTLDYMKNTKSNFVPEDVYFSKTMIDYNIGIVAPRHIAKDFSQETQLSVNPLGGHNHWLAADNKLNKSYINTYKLCNNYYKKVTHRSGWGVIIKNLIKNKVISTNNETNDKSDIILVDCMEDYFLWGTESTDGSPIKKEWYGILHYTDELPHIFNGQNASDVIRHASNSIQNCKGIIVLSDYLKKHIKRILPNIPVYMIKHPIEEIKSKFSLSNFIKNKNYNLIQLGLQYRKVSTIYKIKVEYPKIWLSGTKNKKRLLNILMKELNYLNDSITQESYTKVLTMFTQTIKEFDDLLLNNIVIIPLWNASANNAVLECLEMNIPVFITRMPAVEEYLGKEYPMFYTDISEVEKVINNVELLHQKYRETHEYLLSIDKSDIKLEHFNSELLKIIVRNNKAVPKEIINNKLKCMNIRGELADRTFGNYSYNVLKINEMINCNNHNSYGKSFFVHGFSNIESIGRWSIGDTSLIRFKCEDIGNKNLLINVNPLVNHNQKLSIEINETKTMKFDIESEQTLKLPLIQNKDYPDEVVIIFEYHDIKTPKELGINDDTRELALFFKWIKLV